jgi:transposase
MQLATLRAKYTALAPVFTERSRRVWAATEARAIGHGGIALVERATGISRSTIQRGSRELESGEPLAPERTRKPGAGRKRATAHDETLLADLDALVEPTAPGDPESPLRWTSKSVRTLSVALDALGHEVSHTVVAELLHDLGYSLQGNAKTQEGRQHPDRDAQFRYIAQVVSRCQQRKQPTISVDTKKKELVGDFKNGGRVWRPAGMPDRVRVHDFVIPPTGNRGGKAIPYGVYDLQRNEGWVSVGIDHDTASFAVNAIRRWWQRMGRPVYPKAESLLITADAGGSNGTRLRLWKWELQRFANRTGLAITVCHFPPGTSKWNRIEHRLFSYIATNWRGTPLVNLATIVSLIGSTHSTSGLRVRSEIDRGRYPGGVTVTDAQLAKVRLDRHGFHGDWNYTIHPSSKRDQ